MVARIALLIFALLVLGAPAGADLDWCREFKADCDVDNDGVLDVANRANGFVAPLALCYPIEAPISDEVISPIWRAPTALTATEIWCQAEGGTSVAFDWEIGATGVNGSEITCLTSPTTDSDLVGDTSIADGDTIGLDLGTVTGPVDRVVFCLEFTRP